MENILIKEKLSKQLELLREHSEKCDDNAELVMLTKAMVEVAGFLWKHGED